MGIKKAEVKDIFPKLAVIVQVLCPRVWDSASVGLQPEKKVWICTWAVPCEEAVPEQGWAECSWDLKIWGRYFEKQSCDAQQEHGAGAGMRGSSSDWCWTLGWDQGQGTFPFLTSGWNEGVKKVNLCSLPGWSNLMGWVLCKEGKSRAWIQGGDGRGWSCRGDIHIPFFSKTLAKQNRERKASSSREWTAGISLILAEL